MFCVFYFGRESQDAHVPERASKNLPCESVCAMHVHVQNQAWTDAEGPATPGVWVPDHPVKHCAVLMKTIMVPKGNGKYER